MALQPDVNPADGGRGTPRSPSSIPASPASVTVYSSVARLPLVAAVRLRPDFVRCVGE
jgi:hypothetical protein